ncbi:hypothetical protein EDC01DRAFT_473248 [Geopyxis carbonaria]|nr:hypothetical protein EDC01DRAFT_473248 [Geopyxis carbonaria]
MHCINLDQERKEGVHSVSSCIKLISSFSSTSLSKTGISLGVSSVRLEGFGQCNRSLQASSFIVSVIIVVNSLFPTPISRFLPFVKQIYKCEENNIEKCGIAAAEFPTTRIVATVFVSACLPQNIPYLLSVIFKFRDVLRTKNKLPGLKVDFEQWDAPRFVPACYTAHESF